MGIFSIFRDVELLKEWRKHFDTRVDTLQRDIRADVINILADFAGQFKICDKCGCSVDKDRAVKGRSEIRTRKRFTVNGYGFYKGTREEEFLYTPWYCGRCVPKRKPKKNK